MYLVHLQNHIGKHINRLLRLIVVSFFLLIDFFLWDKTFQLSSLSFTVKNTCYQSQQLGRCFPKLLSITNAETLARKCLSLEPRERIASKDAMKHQFFSELPSKLYQLPDRK